MNTVTAPKHYTVGNGVDPLSDKELARGIPSIFARHAHEDVSSRYAFLPSTTVVKALREEGFVPVQARQYLRRDAARNPYTKHLIRFRAGTLPKLVGGVVPQVVFLNSHDRSSRGDLYGGLFRMVCLNGLIVSDSAVIAPLHIRHVQKPVEELLANVSKIVKAHRNVQEHVEAMRKTTLTERQAIAFARDAAELRNAKHHRKGILLPESMLHVRRPDDAGFSLWNVFNRVQENLLRGGVEGVTASGRHVFTRPNQGLNMEMDVNIGLWEMAMAVINKAQRSSRAAAKVMA